MVATLKSRRRQCGDSMEKDMKQIKWIDVEIEQIMKLYKPLCNQLTERLETKEKVETNLTLAEDTMRTLMSQTKETGNLRKVLLCFTSF